MEKKQPTPAEIVIMASGAVAFIFSFVPWFSSYPSDNNAWSSGLFPVASYLGIFGLLMGAHVAVTKYAHVNLPDRVLSFTWEQIHLALGFFAALLGIGWLILDAGNKKFGLYLSVLAGIGLLVGAILLQKERSTAGGPRTPPLA